MFVLPLGLDARTRRLPIVTLLILVGTVAYSVLRFDDQHESIKKQLNTVEGKKLFEARKALTLAECAKPENEQELEKNDCKFLQDTLHLLTGTNSYSVQVDFLRKVEKRYKLKAEEKFAMFDTYLFNDEHWQSSNLKKSESPEYLAYKTAYEDHLRERTATLIDENSLAQVNFGWRSLLEAQLTHSGWMHLFGNMLFFLLLAIPVEERLGSLAFAFFYFLGGTIGLSLQLPLFENPTMELLGASANVSAVAGLFLILFPKTQMRVWVSYLFLINKSGKVPTWIFIPIFLVLQDVIGVLENDSNIAHVAHLGGLLAGASLAFAWKKRHPLPENVVFPFEAVELEKAYQTEDPIGRIRIAHEILFHNQKNHEAQSLVLEAALHLQSLPQSLPHAAKRALEINFQFIFKNQLDTLPPDEFLAFLASLPNDWPIQDWVHEAEIEKLLSSAQLAEETSRFREAVLIYQVLKACHTSPEFKNKADSKIDELNAKLISMKGVLNERAS